MNVGLPPGWTEHVAPGGQPYYFNAVTQQSTYVRPGPAFPVAPAPVMKKKKEKPLTKTPIPGTEWLRVVTTEGNTFYSHKVDKKSVWTVPEDIKDAVKALEKTEKEREAREGLERAELEQMDEVERVKNEVEQTVKRKAADVEEPLEEVVISKKARVDDDDSDGGSESEEEEWQREAAVQLAAEAEEEKARREEEERQQKEEEEAEKLRFKEARQLHMPDRVDLSVEESKALFKTLLREKNINPLHPWDTSLPLFVNDPRYVLLPSVNARRDAFDEYCRDRARELRQQMVNKEKAEANPKEEYERLLKEEVKSTRMGWTEFRRTWKKDRRFYSWGRDDREREKKFREFVRELGEKRKAAAQKAEANFFHLLRESNKIEKNSVWKDVKKDLYKDSRYDAVGSSSLREELFNTFVKAIGSGSTHELGSNVSSSTNGEAKGTAKDLDQNEVDEDQLRKEKKERAVREREGKVMEKRRQVEADIDRSKSGLDREEGEMLFRTLLTDAIREPQATWDIVLPQLKTDPRYENSPLPLNQQLHLFHSHIAHLRARHFEGLHALFETNAPSLATNFKDLPLESMLSSLPVNKLGLDIDALEYEYSKWHRARFSAARQAFDDMLGENSFVDFWGRLGKIGGEGVDGGVKADEDEGEDGEGGGGRADMKELAKHINLEEIQKVLRNDKRYITFEHVKDEREKWIRDYLANMTASKLSVHVSTK